MSKIIRVLGVLPFAMIVAYWYYVPYQLYLNLVHSTTIGEGAANVLGLYFMIPIGILISVVLGIVGGAMIFHD